MGAKTTEKRVIVTGGAGYIGTHLCIELINQGYEPIIVDNLLGAADDSIAAIEKITGVVPKAYTLDVCKTLATVFKLSNIVAVIHLAGITSVSKCIDDPFECFRVNIGGLNNILSYMEYGNCDKFIFASASDIYSAQNKPPYTEDMPLSSNNPLQTSKIICEKILADASKFNNLKICSLRYFNVVGTHESGFLNDKTQNKDKSVYNMIEFAAQTRKFMSIYGDDYDTSDGTAVRDYIHITDIVNGNIKALEFLENSEKGTFEIFNLGTGKPLTVLELIKAYQKSKNCNVRFEIMPRRQDDVPISEADITKAKKMLNWEAILPPV